MATRSYILVCLSLLSIILSSCSLLHHNSKYNFNDGIYYSDFWARHPVYIHQLTDDTIIAFPVIMFPDSTAILMNQMTIYADQQKKFKDNLTQHTFYKPSFDLDVMTIPLKYRPAEGAAPHQLTTNFNGAVFFGYRIDQYTLNYERTPLNNYKQDIQHLGYSLGLFAGIGGTVINTWQINNALPFDYEGVTLITGISANVAMQSVDFGLSLGFDHLMDGNHKEWIYEGKPCIGFTLGLNLN
jgi:hypothetical protein